MARINKSVRIRREVAFKTAHAILHNDLSKLDTIPYEMAADDENAARCCIHHDRAVIRSRILASLGHDPAEIAPEVRISDIEHPPAPQTGIKVIKDACNGCPASSYVISDQCKYCLDQSCREVCPRNAVFFAGEKAHIIQDSCIKCGKCADACAYNAVVKTTLPCIDACPVQAIERTGNEAARIDEDTCIECGLCMNSCPFGAITHPSHLSVVSRMLAGPDTKTTAMLAPSIQGQLPGTYKQIINSLLQLGFSRIVEVASGAEITAANEAAEVITAAQSDTPGFVTSSCCPAYVGLSKNKIPGLKQYISHTRSPLYYTGSREKQLHPEHMRVFIGPCIAKKNEARSQDSADAVLTFEELGALIVAAGIEVTAMPKELKSCDQDAIKSVLKSDQQFAHNFARPGGVKEAIQQATTSKQHTTAFTTQDRAQKAPVCAEMSGLTKKNQAMLSLWTKKPEKAEFDFIEVMCCPEGCIGGPGVICSPKISRKELDNFGTKWK